MTQEQRQPRQHDSSEQSPEELDTTEARANLAERKESLDNDIDDILDEIDDVLETNAEDFVKSFVQKGGQ